MEGKLFLINIGIDAHLKWIEIIPMTSALIALTTVQHLHQLFSRFGIPDSIMIMSINGSQFVAIELEVCKSNGIQHICVTVPSLT